MFKAITWGQYIGFVSVLLLLYYAYLALTYYRAELMGLFKGKSKATDPALAATSAAGALVGRGSLIPKSVAVPAVAPVAAPPKVARPAPASDKASELAETEESNQAEAPTEQAFAAGSPAEELPALDLPADNTQENNVETVNHDDIYVDIKYNFTERIGADSFRSASTGLKIAAEEFEPGVTFGIAQLGNYLERAAEGQITKQELTKEEPDLAATELMVAFFQTSTKRAQRAASHLYADIAEPALG